MVGLNDIINPEELKKENEKDLALAKGEAEEVNPFYLPHFLTDKGYYSDNGAVYYPLKDLSHYGTGEYYLKISRIKPTGNSKQTYQYCYYEKTKDIELNEPFTTELSPYEHLSEKQVKELDEINKKDKKAIAIKTLNRHLGNDCQDIPAYKDNSTEINKNYEKVEGFVKKNLQQLKEDLHSIKLSYGWVSGLKKDYKPPEVTEEEHEEVEEVVIDEKEVTSKANDLISYLKNKKTEFIPYVMSRAEWLNAGELTNTMIGFIVLCSGFLGVKPLNLIVLGESAEGKSFLISCIIKLLPEEAVGNGRITEAVLHRKSLKYGADYLSNTILNMGDLGGSKDLNKWEPTLNIYKELQSEGVVEKEVTGDGKDKETGEKTLLEMKLEGYVACILSTVKTEEVDNQLRNRGIELTPKATNMQVSWFNKYNRGQYKQKRKEIIEEDIGEYIHNYLRYLKRKYRYDLENEELIDSEGNIIEFINPFYIDFDIWLEGSAYYKRNSVNYEKILFTICLLNAPLREHETVDGKKYIIVAKDDIETMNKLFNPATQLTPLAQLLFNRLLELFVNKEDLENRSLDNYQYRATTEFTAYEHGETVVRDFKYIFNVSELKHRVKSPKLKNTDLGKMLYNLNNEGLIEVLGETKKRSGANIYALSQLEPISSVNIELKNSNIREYCENELELIYGFKLENIPYVITKSNGKDKKKENKGFIEWERPPWVVSPKNH